jgi:hypothetical protein
MVIDMSKARTSQALVMIIVGYTCCWTAAMAADVQSKAYPSLPLATRDYDASVQALATETNGNEMAMAKKLQALGFTCTPVSKSISFGCVRFGCRKGGALGLGSLLQWWVGRFDVVSGKTVYSGSAVDYSWSARCIPENDIEEAQRKFISRRIPIQ